MFPYKLENYKEFYTAKFAFVVTPIGPFWRGDIHNSACNTLREKGYYVYSKFFQHHSNKDSILFNKKFKAFEGQNIFTIERNTKVQIESARSLL